MCNCLYNFYLYCISGYADDELYPYVKFKDSFDKAAGEDVAKYQAALKNALAERKAAVAAYEEAHGALTHDGLLASQTYDWVERPFPFE